MNTHRTLGCVIAALALAAVPAAATTITVDTDVDADAADGFCSLREAILAANADVDANECAAGDGPDRVVFDLAFPTTIVLTADLPAITESLLIRGPHPLELTVDGGDHYRLLVFDTPAGGWLGVEQITLAHGHTSVGDGGGAYIAAGETGQFHRVRFLANHTGGTGGGLALGADTSSDSLVRVTDCLFEDNVSEGPAGGGGFATTGSGGTVEISGSTFVGNAATHSNGSGGGLHIRRTTASIRTSTISGNRASAYGGGLRVSSTVGFTTALTIEDSTIVDNTAAIESGVGRGGGGLYLAPSSDAAILFSIVNTVVAENEDLEVPEEADILCHAIFAGLSATGSNLIGSNTGCDTHFPVGTPNAAGDLVGTDTAPLDPLLQPLADHGGPTPVHRPNRSPLSPLVDQGTCAGAIADQRGHGDLETRLRPLDLPAVPDAAGGDGCDIGAFEVLAEPNVDPSLFADGFESGTDLLWSLSSR